jgi:hypothetical protein
MFLDWRYLGSGTLYRYNGKPAIRIDEIEPEAGR